MERRVAQAQASGRREAGVIKFYWREGGLAGLSQVFTGSSLATWVQILHAEFQRYSYNGQFKHLPAPTGFAPLLLAQFNKYC